MAILDIRGTHGSGKSTIPHTLLKTIRHVTITEDGKHIGYKLIPYDCAIVGKYATVCGGCDGVGKADEIVRRVKLFAELYRHVLLEGILVSHTFGRYNELAGQLPDYKFLFLDTPLETCIERVKARRLASGNEKPLDPKNVIKDWNTVWGTVREKLENAGREVIVLDHRNPMPAVRQLLSSRE